jgi:thioredoxin reductase (NADPH)
VRNGAECMKLFTDQAVQLGVHLVPLSVIDVDFSTWPFPCRLSNETTVYVATITCCQGASQQKLGIEGETTYWGKGLFTCGLCDASYTRGKDATIIGGTDIAVQRALQLLPDARTITLIVPGEQMSAHASMQKKIEGISNIKKLYNKTVTKILGNGTSVDSVELYDSKTKKSSTIPTEAVFLSTGLTPNTELIKDKLEILDNGCIKLLGDSSQQTTVEGVGAAGTIAENRYRQIGSILGDGTKAGLDAIKLL